MNIIEALEEMEDKRIDRCKKHKLSDILMLCLPGFLFGLKDIENIVYWAELREKRLKQVMSLENGIPSADTILRVLSIIDPKQFERGFTKVTHSYFNENSEQDFVALDGKTIRGSKKEGNKGVHIVSAWAHKLGLCLGQVKTEEWSGLNAIGMIKSSRTIKGITIYENRYFIASLSYQILIKAKEFFILFSKAFYQ